MGDETRRVLTAKEARLLQAKQTRKASINSTNSQDSDLSKSNQTENSGNRISADSKSTTVDGKAQIVPERKPDSEKKSVSSKEARMSQSKTNTRPNNGKIEGESSNLDEKNVNNRYETES